MLENKNQWLGQIYNKKKYKTVFQKLKKDMVSSFLSPKVLGNNIHIQ